MNYNIRIQAVNCSLPPSLFLSRTVKLWREDLAKTNAKAAASLADPTEYENLFPELQSALKAEQYIKDERENLVPASEYLKITVSHVTRHVMYYGLSCDLSSRSVIGTLWKR